MKNKYVCTYFNENFISRGCAMIESLLDSNNCIIYVLALDETTLQFLKNKYEKVILLDINNYIDYFKIEINKFEDKKQFFFSITPNLCLWLLEKYKEIDILLYLDADVYVYSDLEPIYQELKGYSIAASSHRQNKLVKFFSNHYGKYNVGINLFRNDKIGKKCIKKWKENCDNWYPDMPDYPLSYFSDQIFLDDWPYLYKNSFKEIENIGVNVAPWNAINYKIRLLENKFYVNEFPLIIYHFSSLIKVSENVWNSNSSFFIFRIDSGLKKLYLNYLEHVLKFNVNNKNIVKLHFSGSIKKKLFHAFFGFFFKNKIKIKQNDER